MGDIAAAAGVSRQTLYKEFGNRNEFGFAFVINVGLFVKAKINLQNATDASAFEGAAVQARQMTDQRAVRAIAEDVDQVGVEVVRIVVEKRLDVVRRRGGRKRLRGHLPSVWRAEPEGHRGRRRAKGWTTSNGPSARLLTAL